MNGTTTVTVQSKSMSRLEKTVWGVSRETADGVFEIVGLVDGGEEDSVEKIGSESQYANLDRRSL